MVFTSNKVTYLNCMSAGYDFADDHGTRHVGTSAKVRVVDEYGSHDFKVKSSEVECVVDFCRALKAFDSCQLEGFLYNGNFVVTAIYKI